MCENSDGNMYEFLPNFRVFVCVEVLFSTLIPSQRAVQRTSAKIRGRVRTDWPLSQTVSSVTGEAGKILATVPISPS